MFRKSLLSLGLLGNGISASVASFPNWQAAASPLLRVSASTERALFAFVGPLFVSHCGPQVDGLRSKPLAEGRVFSRSTVLPGLGTAIARLEYRNCPAWIPQEPAECPILGPWVFGGAVSSQIWLGLCRVDNRAIAPSRRGLPANWRICHRVIQNLVVQTLRFLGSIPRANFSSSLLDLARFSIAGVLLGARRAENLCFRRWV